jgi:transcription termination factor NusA
MNNELLDALTILEKEKNISKETLLEAIENSLLTACKNHFGKADNVKVVIDPDTCEYHCYQEKTVVETVEDPIEQISLQNAQMINGKYTLGDIVQVEVKSKEFGRIATQNAKNVILQKIREEERKVIYDEYFSMEKEVVTGVVQRYVGRNVSINLGKADALLTESEQIKGETFQPTERIKVYILEVKATSKGPKILVSRTHPELVKRLFESEVSEVRDGIVEIKAISREAGSRKITVKGGKYLEAVAEADTIVFDKTGTLTKAQPTVAGVVSFNGTSENELLRIAACLEEHFPHSIAKAVVDAAKRKNLDHEEMHSEVKYIVAHGISTTIGDSKAIIGSYHFVFEDEKCTIPEGMEEVFENLPAEYSHLYLAIDNELAAAILIEDPLREESADIVERLKSVGISKVVMMTGDCERTAKAIAEHVGVDEYYSEVLPEDKAAFVDREKAAGRKVIMIGDGINDSPALSAADAGR